jgi:hypothetical protein
MPLQWRVTSFGDIMRDVGDATATRQLPLDEAARILRLSHRAVERHLTSGRLSGTSILAQRPERAKSHPETRYW